MSPEVKKGLLIKAIQVAVVLLAFITGLLGSVVYFKYRFKSPAQQTVKPSFDIPEAKTLETVQYNIVLLGYGGEGHDGGYLSDVIMILNINPETGKIQIISVPRDLWVDIPVRSDLKEKHKINSAYAIGVSNTMYPLKETKYRGENGGGILIEDVLERVTGLKSDHYLAVNFGNFKKIIDTLGGVEVEVPVTFEDNFYPVKGLENETCGFSAEEIAAFHQKYSGFELEKQFTCRYEKIRFTAGKTTMDGDTALKFVRSRHSDTYGGDFSRSERQKAVLIGIKNKLISLTAIKSARELFSLFSGLVQTDIDIETFGGFVKLLGDLSRFEVGFSSLNDKNVLMPSVSVDGQYILIPKSGMNNWEGIKNFIAGEIK